MKNAQSPLILVFSSYPGAFIKKSFENFTHSYHTHGHGHGIINLLAMSVNTDKSGLMCTCFKPIPPVS